MLKAVVIVGLTAAIGGVVGGSGWLCPDGSCPITGSWFGGATVGGFLGLSLSGFGGGAG